MLTALTHAAGLRQVVSLHRWSFLSNIRYSVAKNDIGNHRLYNTSPPPNPSVENVHQLLINFENHLKSTSSSKIDHLISTLQSLHELNVIIPSWHFTISIKLLAQRNDTVRTELLLHLAEANSQLRNINTKSSDSDLSISVTKSNPTYSLSHHLTQFAITQLFRLGHASSSLRLWMRLASHGFTTSRSGLETLLEGASSPRAAPPLQFIDKMHRIMTGNVWNQTPVYYCHILRVLQQYLVCATPCPERLRHAHSRLLSLSQEAKETVSGRDVGLETGKLSLWLCLLTLSRKLYRESSHGKKDTENSEETEKEIIIMMRECVNNSKIVFEQVLESVQCVTEEVDLSPWIPSILCVTSSVKKRYNVEERERNEETERDSERERGEQELTKRGRRREAREREIENMHCTVAIFFREIAREESGTVAIKLLSDYLTVTASLYSPTLCVSGASSRSSQHHMLWLVSSLLYGAGERVNDLRQKEGLQIEEKETLVSIVSDLKELMREREVEWGVSLYVGWIEGLAQERRDWETALLEVRDIEKECLSECGEAEEVRAELCHAVVSLLTRSGQSRAVLEARDEMTLRLQEGTRIRSKTWAQLLRAAHQYSSLSDLSCILSFVEASSKRAVPGMSDKLWRDDDERGMTETEKMVISRDAQIHERDVPLLLSARLLAHARLCHGYSAFQLLREMRKRDVACSLSLYHAVIRAITNTRVQQLTGRQREKSLEVITRPTATIQWLLREMLEEGRLLSEPTQSFLMELYVSAIRISRFNLYGIDLDVLSHPIPTIEDVINSAEKFLEMSADEGVEGHPAVPVTERSLRVLVKTCCVGGKEEKALEIINSMRVKYDIMPTALSYTPLIHHLAVISRSVQAAEDALTLMNNASVAPNSDVVDCLVTGLLLQDDHTSALDIIQEMYNQHSVRPSTRCMLKLLDNALHRGDFFEARRGLVVIEQLFPERDSMLEGGELSTISLDKRIAKYEKMNV